MHIYLQTSYAVHHLFSNEVVVVRMLFSSLERRSRASLSPDLVKHEADALQQQKTTLGAKNWKNIFCSNIWMFGRKFGVNNMKPSILLCSNSSDSWGYCLGTLWVPSNT